MKMKFVEVPQYGDEFAKMQQFAKSFDHVINPMRNGKLVAFEKDDRVYGYADIIYLPIAFPAFHPEVTTARGVVEVIDGWKAHCQLSTGGQGFIGVPLEQDRKTFPPEMLENAGFSQMKREIYYITEAE